MGSSQPTGRFTLASSLQRDGSAGAHDRAAQRASVLRVNGVVRSLLAKEGSNPLEAWLSSVAVFVTRHRPDIADSLTGVLCAEPDGDDLLDGLSIGEIGVCYEALRAQIDPASRRASGQFFTPDDASRFMAAHSSSFPRGVWMDPCCGIGNLAWHLVDAQEDPSEFTRSRLVLMDLDVAAVRSAVALIAASFLAPGDSDGVRRLAGRAVVGDFLTKVDLPMVDFAIANPPYARASAPEGYETADCKDMFAFFIERIAECTKGFIAVTPASYLSAPKFESLRRVLDRDCSGGDIYAFDNVPDTLFRGFKFGSTNSSKTNFVRAAIMVCPPESGEWRVTPIIRWQRGSRQKMFERCSELLLPRRVGPNGEWVKIVPQMLAAWEELGKVSNHLSDLVAKEDTEFRLEVPLTPRYYVSASYMELERSSKVILNFRTSRDRDLAALVLNSSIPYFWWRALDGGISLPRRVLFSVPIPDHAEPTADLVGRLRDSERENVVVKMNAGRANENVRHPRELVQALNEALMPSGSLRDLDLIYAPDMFSGHHLR